MYTPVSCASSALYSAFNSFSRHIENENELNALYNADDAQLTGLFSLKHFVGQAVHSFPYHCRSYI